MSIQAGNILFDHSSLSSTSCDSSSEPDEDGYVMKTNPLKHKTEFCKTFSELGFCNYGYKCRFAHSREELVVLPVSEAFRKKKCKGFWANGCCPYGLRCQFGHAKINWEDKVCLLGLQAWSKDGKMSQKASKLLRMLR